MQKQFNQTPSSQLAIEAAIFKGAGVSEPRGFRDAFSDEQIMGMLSHPDYEKVWTSEFKNWLWNCIDSIYREEEESEALT